MKEGGRTRCLSSRSTASRLLSEPLLPPAAGPLAKGPPPPPAQKSSKKSIPSEKTSEALVAGCPAHSSGLAYSASSVGSVRGGGCEEENCGTWPLPPADAGEAAVEEDPHCVMDTPLGVGGMTATLPLENSTRREGRTAACPA